MLGDNTTAVPLRLPGIHVYVPLVPAPETLTLPLKPLHNVNRVLFVTMVGLATVFTKMVPLPTHVPLLADTV